MGKFRIVAEIIGLVIAVLALITAYIQYQTLQATIKISESVQEQLQNLPADRDAEVNVINSAIEDLSGITGNAPKPISPDENDRTLQKSETAIPDSASQEEQQRLSQIKAVQFESTRLRVGLLDVRTSADKRRVIITTEFENLTDEPLYIGKSGRPETWFAASDTGQALRIDSMEAIGWDKSDRNELVRLEPHQPMTIPWNVSSKGGAIFPGRLDIRGRFMLHGKLRSDPVQVQLRGIDFAWGLPLE